MGAAADSADRHPCSARPSARLISDRFEPRSRAGASGTRLSHVNFRSTAMKSILLAAILALVANAASAHEYKAGSIEIKHPWARATPKGSEVAGGFMKLINTGTEPDRLIGGSTASAGKFENHQAAVEGGVVKMRPLPEGTGSQPGEDGG